MLVAATLSSWPRCLQSSNTPMMSNRTHKSTARVGIFVAHQRSTPWHPDHVGSDHNRYCCLLEWWFPKRSSLRNRSHPGACQEKTCAGHQRSLCSRTSAGSSSSAGWFGLGKAFSTTFHVPDHKMFEKKIQGETWWNTKLNITVFHQKKVIFLPWKGLLGLWRANLEQYWAYAWPIWEDVGLTIAPMQALQIYFNNI